MLPNHLRLALSILATTAALCGQAHYFVDGTLGVDAPGYGTSASSPWRTIGHALAHAQAPASGAVVVQVRGDQVYAPGTNGETFPLVVPPRVALEGVAGSQGQRPVLLLPTGAIGLLLPAAASFDADYCLLRGLAIEGGDTGLQLGSQAGQQHRVTIEDCDFRLQVGQAVHLVAAGGIDVLGMRSSRFTGTNQTGAGVVLSLQGALSHPTIDLELCRWQDLADAVRCVLPGTSGTGSRPSVSVRHSNIEQCQNGVRYSGYLAGGSTTRLLSTRIANGNRGVVLADIGSSSPHTIELEDCALLQLETGIDVESVFFSYGSRTVLLDRCVIAGCQTGASMRLGYNAFHQLTATDCTFRDNGTSVRGHANFDFARMVIEVTRCRFLRGGAGIIAHFDTYESRLVVANSVFARQGTCIYFWGYDGSWDPWPSTINLGNLTLADSQTALVVPSTGGMSYAGRLLFSDNVTDAVVTPQFPISHSLTDGPTLPGTNNQVLTDAQLLRPSYQLAPTSPCITPNGRDIGYDEFVPTGSLRRYGTPGTSPLGTTPRIGSPDTTAIVGSTFTVELSAPPPAGFAPSPAMALLALGFAEPAPPLLFDLSGAGIAGVLWVDPLAFELPVAVSPAGTAAIPQTIPNHAWLAGLPVFYQWLVVSAVDGMVTSDGLRVTFGG